MDIMAKIAAAKAKAKEQKAAALAAATPKPRYRVRNGKVIIRMYAVLAKPKPASNVKQLVSEKYKHLEYDRQPVRIGEKCKHDMPGRPGFYKNPNTGEIGKCWVCNGKGRIDARDKAFDDQRRAGRRGPICHMRSAA